MLPGVAMASSYAQEVLNVRARPALDVFGVPVALAGALVCVASVAIAAASAPSDAAFGRGLLQLLIVGGPIAVGLYALRGPANRSFGVALLSIGFLWSLTALTTSSVQRAVHDRPSDNVADIAVRGVAAAGLPARPDREGTRSCGPRRLLRRVAALVLRHRTVRAGVPSEDVVVDLRAGLPGERPVRAPLAAEGPDAGHPGSRVADRAAVARLGLFDVPPLACGLAAAAARDRPGVRRRDAARRVAVGAHHDAPTRRAGRLRDRAVLGVDTLHRRRLRGVPVRPGLETNAASPGRSAA